MDNSGREELLLEVIKDFTGITYPEYADEDNIKEKIIDYIHKLKKFKLDPDHISFDDLNKLNELNKFFYGVSFDPKNPNANINKTPIYDKFKKTYDKVDKLVNETNDINAELLKSLLNITSVYYDPSKNKDAATNEYLDKIIIPLLNKYKGIGVVADSSLKEEKITEVKSDIGKKVSTIVNNDRNTKENKEKKEKEILRDKNDAALKKKEEDDDRLRKDKTLRVAPSVTTVDPNQTAIPGTGTGLTPAQGSAPAPAPAPGSAPAPGPGTGTATALLSSLSSQSSINTSITTSSRIE
jgi:hypothetical protein